MKKVKLLGMLILISLISINFVQKVNSDNSYIWIYEENLNDFLPSTGALATYQGYNRFSVSETKKIDTMSLYIWTNPSNETQTEELKLAIYSNYNNSPSALLTQTYATKLLKVGWENMRLQTPIHLTCNVDYWCSIMIKHDVTNPFLNYRIVTNPLTYSHVQENRTWDIPSNPANVTSIVEGFRYGAFRVGLSYTIPTTDRNFIDIFENPTTYIAGLVVCSLIIMIVYYFIKRR